MGSSTESPRQRPKSCGQAVNSPSKHDTYWVLDPTSMAWVEETRGQAVVPSPRREDNTGAGKTAYWTKKMDGRSASGDKSGNGIEKDNKGAASGQHGGRGGLPAVEGDKGLTAVRPLSPRRASHASSSTEKTKRCFAEQKSLHAEKKKKKGKTRVCPEQVGVSANPQSPTIKAEPDAAREKPLSLLTGVKEKAKSAKGDDATARVEAMKESAPGSEPTRGSKNSPGIKAERSSTTVVLLPQYRDGDRAKTTSSKNKGAAEHGSKAGSLSDQVRSLEKKEELQRRQRKVLAAENRRMSRDLDRLKQEHASALSKASSLEFLNQSLHSIRRETAKKLSEASEALQTERARTEGLGVAVETAKGQAKDGAFELRKFRTALAAAFKLLPALEDQVSFRGLVERTERHLREKLAREDAARRASSVADDEAARRFESKLLALVDDGRDDDDDDVKPNLNAEAVVGPDVNDEKPGADKTELGTAQPRQASAERHRGLKRDRQDTARGGWSDDEFDVPLAKRRRGI